MTCTIVKEPGEAFITLKYEGKVTRNFVFSRTLEAHALGAQLGINCYLVDMIEARNADSVLNNYQFVHTDLRSSGINVHARVAVLVTPDDHSHDFVVLVSQNASNNVHIFNDRALAVQFLAPT